MTSLKLSKEVNSSFFSSTYWLENKPKILLSPLRERTKVGNRLFNLLGLDQESRVFYCVLD